MLLRIIWELFWGLLYGADVFVNAAGGGVGKCTEVVAGHTARNALDVGNAAGDAARKAEGNVVGNAVGNAVRKWLETVLHAPQHCTN